MTDYSIIHAPRITAACFAAVLHRAGSPAAAVASDAYAAARARGVDPAVMLAIFQHESGYGRAGAAVLDHSWGNERTAAGGYPIVGGFVRFPTWLAGATNTASLLRLYGLSRIRTGTDTSTVRRLPYVWAPAADHNKPDAYGAALVASIASYIALGRTLAGVSTHPTHRTPYADVRLRAKASTAAVVVRTVHAGATARVAATVIGAAYTLPDGRHSTRWVRIVAVGGVALPSPAYSAALLWVAL